MGKIWSNSSDAHVMEPEDLWDSTLPKALADRAPKVVKDETYETIYVDGQRMRRFLGEWLDTFRPPGAWDVQQRLVDMDSEGIWSALLFPSQALWLFHVRDNELLNACAGAYNDWLRSEVCSASPRILGAGLVNLCDTDMAVAGIQAAVDHGFPAVALPTTPPPGRDYNDEVWEPFWAAAEEAGIVLAFHIGTGAELNVTHGPGGAVINYMETAFPAYRTATHLVASGALDRHQNLKVMIAEGGCAWVPVIGDRLDESYRQHGVYVSPKLSRLPSEILKSQVYTSFQHDRTAIPAVTAMGYDLVMWGDDYPHLEGTWGHTQQTLEDLTRDVAPEVRERVLVSNFEKLLNAPPLPAGR